VSAPPYVLRYTAEFEKIVDDLAASPPKSAGAIKLTKIRKTLRQLEDPGPSYPGLHSHLYQSVKGPDGAQLWESYVENRTPGAWRLFWVYGPEPDEITAVTVGPHP
jgi:hypothetical protein